MSEQQLTFNQKFSQSLSYLWNNHKVFLVVFGLLIVAAKFSGVILEFLAFSSKKTLDNAVKQDATLKTQENAANQAANELVQEAKSLETNKGSVDEDWHKKK